jgi:hypothetical protein
MIEHQNEPAANTYVYAEQELQLLRTPKFPALAPAHYYTIRPVLACTFARGV